MKERTKARALSALSFISNEGNVYEPHDFPAINEEKFACQKPWFSARLDSDNGGIIHCMCGDEPCGFLSVS